MATVTKVQLPDDKAVAATVSPLMKSIPEDKLNAFKALTEGVYEQSYSNTLEAIRNKNTSGLSEAEKTSLEQARGEVSKTLSKDTELNKAFSPQELEDLTAKRAAGINYDKIARSEAKKLTYEHLDTQFKEGKLAPLTTHARGEERVAMINGGQASGTGSNVHDVTNKIAADSGLGTSDRILVSADSFKPILAGPEHTTGDTKYVQSQLLQTEVALVKGQACLIITRTLSATRLFSLGTKNVTATLKHSKHGVKTSAMKGC